MRAANTKVAMIIGVGMIATVEFLYAVVIPDAWLTLGSVRWAYIGCVSSTALLVSYIAPDRKILIGSLTSVVASIMYFMTTIIRHALGFPIDSVGPVVTAIFFIISVLLLLPLCFAGAVIGDWLSKRSGKAMSRTENTRRDD